MLKILGVVAIVLLVGIGGVFAFAATRPDTFEVRRSIRIEAPPERVFPLIAGFRQWAAWSPYERLDPDMKRTYGGPPSGRGATYAWEGDSKAGAGGMRITEAQAPEKVVLDLNFTKPFKTGNVVRFTLARRGDATEVTWAMRGPMPFVSKVMCLFFDMDAMIGKDFEMGLARLKAAAER